MGQGGATVLTGVCQPEGRHGAQKAGSTVGNNNLLTIALRDITDTELTSVNLKTGKKLRFPLYDEAELTTVKLAIDGVIEHYQRIRADRASKRKPVVMSQWLFHNRAGGCYWNFQEDTASGFDSIWQRAMKKALAETKLEESFTDHDLRAKGGSMGEYPFYGGTAKK